MKDLGCKNSFKGVADRVAKVEQVAQTAFTLVCRDNLRLDTYRTEHDALQDIRNAIEIPSSSLALLIKCCQNCVCVALECCELLLVPDSRCLHHLSHTIDDFALRQGLEELKVDVDALRLPEGTHQVLARRCVNSCLSANTRVNHGQQGCRHLHEFNTAHIGGSDEANHVTNDTPTQSDNDGVARASLRQQPIFYYALCVSRLRVLARWNRVCEETRFCCAGRGGGGESLLEGRDVRGTNIGVGDKNVGRRRNVLDQVVGDVALP